MNFEKLMESVGGNGKLNYVSWRFKLNNLLLRLKGLLDVAMGVTLKPFENDQGYAEWLKKDIEAQTIIGMNVDEKIALKITTCTTSMQMIERLEALYGKKSQKSTAMLHQQFFSYRYDDS